MTDGHEPGAPGIDGDGGPGRAPSAGRAPGAEGAERADDYGRTGPGAEGAPADDGNGDGSPDGPVAPVEADDPLTVAVSERDEYLDALRRLQAEFENYKKRVAKQQSEQTARAAVALVDKMLPVLDTLDMATEHVGDAESADGRALVAVAGQIRDVLSKEGLERIDPVGEEFDPTAHDAVGHMPAEDDDGATGEGSSGLEPTVAQVMRAGYRWRGTVVRPAMVMVRG